MLEFFAINVKANFLSVKKGEEKERKKEKKKGKDHQSGSLEGCRDRFRMG